MSSLWTEILRVLWLSVPVVAAALVHVAVIRFRLFPALVRPIDGGRSWRGARLFGDHKTWRGAVVMIGVSALVMPLQGLARAPGLELFDYGAHSLFAVGALLGLGFVLGELPNSFLKRRAGVGPGERGGAGFVLLDQIDSIVGALLLLCLVQVPPLSTWIVALILCSLLHVAVNGVFVLAGLKERVL